MKKITIIFISFFLSLYSPMKAQIEEPLLIDIMTSEQARFSLRQQMATIEYYFFQNYFDADIRKAAENYYYTFTRRSNPFTLLPRQTLVEKIEKKEWNSYLHFTNRGHESYFRVRHDFQGRDVNEHRHYTAPLPHRNQIKKVFYANGTIETDPAILQTSKWFQDYRPIDSVLVDATIVYPVETEVTKMSVMQAQIQNFPDGGFIWLMNYDGERLSLSVTENIVGRLAIIQILTESGQRLENSRSVYTPKQPTGEMYTYASAFYQHCSKLLNKLDRGLYASTGQMIREHTETAPVPPAIRYINRYSCEIPEDAKTVEFVCYSGMDSVVLKDLMIKPREERMCDYGIGTVSTGEQILYGVVDLNGRWVVKPRVENGIFVEVAGIFYKPYSDDFEKKHHPLLVVNKEKQTLENTPYEVHEVFDKTFLLVEGADKRWGILHRNGSTLLPARFKEITYDEKSRSFMARQEGQPEYLLFDEKGKSL